jgi:hypothetical protein
MGFVDFFEDVGSGLTSGFSQVGGFLGNVGNSVMGLGNTLFNTAQKLIGAIGNIGGGLGDLLQYLPYIAIAGVAIYAFSSMRKT